jgi:hypothetical protein
MRRPRLPQTPAGRVFAVLALFWVGYYFAWTPESTEPARGDGTYHTILDRGDGHYMYLATESLVLDRDLDLRNQFQLAGDPFKLGEKIVPATGRHAIYPAGTSILQIPCFLVAEAAAATANLFGAGLPMHGHTYFHERITFLGSLLAGFFTLVFGYRIARRRVSETAALWGAVLAGVSGPILFYSVINPSYAHSWTAGTVALALDTWDRTRGREDLRRWIAIGLTFGLAALSREQEIIFTLAPAIEATALVVGHLRERRVGAALRLSVHALLAGFLTLLVLFPSLLANKVVFGSYLANPSGAHYMRWSSPFFWETLFSVRNGLFIWTPLCYLGIVGLFAAPRSARPFAALLLAMFLADTWVNGSAWAYWSDYSFSNRRFVDCTVLFVIGIGFVVERLRAIHARFPRLAPHVALGLAMLPFVAVNMDQACIRGGHPRSDIAQPIGEAYGGLAKRTIEHLFNTPLGSPTAWPANWIWAAKHGVSPSRWDTLAPDENLFIAADDLDHPGKSMREVIRLEEKTATLHGAGPIDKNINFHPGSRFLFSLFIWDNVTITLDLTCIPGGTVEVNGDPQPIPASPTAQKVVLTPTNLHAGVNELRFDSEVILTQVELVWKNPG